MASKVTMLFFSDSVSSSAGIAVISFDLPSTSRWPSARPCSLAHALTRCSGPCARPRSKERRSVLPSIATTSRSKASAQDWAQALKQASKASGSISLKTRRKVSCEGMPLAKLRNASPACYGHRARCPLGARDHRTHRDHQDVDQPMLDLAGTPRILKRRKVLDQLLNRHRRPPFVDEGRTGTAHQTVKANLPFSCVASGVARGTPVSCCRRQPTRARNGRLPQPPTLLHALLPSVEQQADRTTDRAQ